MISTLVSFLTALYYVYTILILLYIIMSWVQLPYNVWIGRVRTFLHDTVEPFAVGHDLVGASGFSTAVWADYSSLTMSWQVLEKLRLFGYGSFFRNGPMPNIGVFPLKVDQEKGVAAGYGLGAGAEWRFNRYVAIQASYDRIDQVGSVDPAQTSLTRNIVAARLTVDAF